MENVEQLPEWKHKTYLLFQWWELRKVSINKIIDLNP